MMETLTRQQIEHRIMVLRGKQVLLDYDLAEMYQVETRVLNQAVKRNLERFPESFRFRLTSKDLESLKDRLGTNQEAHASKSQFVILNSVNPKQGDNIKHMPHAFTEQGVAMLSAVLRSKIAVMVSIQIMEAFVKMRKVWADHAIIDQRLDRLEYWHYQTEERFGKVFDSLSGLEWV